jgi:hypothetical protein
MGEDYERVAIELTSAELSHVWSAYMENSMIAMMFQYFQETAEDKDIKKIVGDILNNSEKSREDLKEYFEKENIQIPHGFNSDDVKVKAPKLYSDVFILYFCDDILKLKSYVYSSALCDSTRKDVRDFFSKNIDIYKTTQNDLVDLMLSRGVYIRPPQVTVEKQVDFIEKKNYLKGLFGNTRPINVAEIASINRLLQKASFAKMMLMSFAQVSSDKDVSQNFIKGKTLSQSIIDDTRSILEAEDLTAPGIWDLKCYESTDPPFSDRLMLFFLIICTGVLCFSNAAQGITASLRTDISAKFAGFVTSMAGYFGGTIKLMIEKGYFERPLQVVDRNKIRKIPKDFMRQIK